jgi:hypothetical protein
VTDRAELDRLPSTVLHDRAVRLAEHRLDVAFLWRLLKAVPAAEAAAGHLDEARADVGVGDLVPWLHDLSHAGEGEVGEALRPLYIEYLEKHERPERG